MKLCVTGVGYVGLVTAACFAEVGNSVVCVDKDKDKIEGLKRGRIPIYEPGLEPIVQRNVEAGRLVFTTELKAGVDAAQVVFLAVGTPSKSDGWPDMSAVQAVAESIGDLVTKYRILVMKSTVPVGTHQQVRSIVRSRTEVEFDYVSNPEFLKEGAAVDDFMSPDRVIVGTTSSQARTIMANLYKPFMRRSNRLIFMDPASAEMTKYAANTMLATRISFMNEMAALCEKVGADVDLVRHGIGSDGRIGSAFLFPGVGFGGSCFPKDVSALRRIGGAKDLPMHMANAVWQTNLEARQRFADRVIAYFADRENTQLGVWGLAFKANTDDLRESPAVFCVQRFAESGMAIKGYDPRAGRQELAGLSGLQMVDNAYDVLDGSDALVVLTDWQEFRNPDFARIAETLNEPVVFDGRNLYDCEMTAAAGIEYHSVGRPSVYPAGPKEREL